MRISPSQKPGTARPTDVTPMTARSSTDPGRWAATIPAGTPTTMAMAVPANVNDRVAGSRSLIDSITGWLLNSDVPRSPWMASPSQSM